jgi:hypothetical protein
VGHAERRAVDLQCLALAEDLGRDGSCGCRWEVGLEGADALLGGEALAGVLLREDGRSRASVICGREVEMPESTISLPSGPGRTAMLPPEPIKTLTLPRRAWVVIFAVAAEARPWITTSGCAGVCAKRLRGETQAAVAAKEPVARKRRRETSMMSSEFLSVVGTMRLQ